MKLSAFAMGLSLLAATVVADETFVLDEDFFKVEEIQDLNSHASAWEADPYYAAVTEESLQQLAV